MRNQVGVYVLGVAGFAMSSFDLYGSLGGLVVLACGSLYGWLLLAWARRGESSTLPYEVRRPPAEKPVLQDSAWWMVGTIYDCRPGTLKMYSDCVVFSQSPVADSLSNELVVSKHGMSFPRWLYCGLSLRHGGRRYNFQFHDPTEPRFHFRCEARAQWKRFVHGDVAA